MGWHAYKFTFVQDVFCTNCVAGVFVISILLGAFLPKDMQIESFGERILIVDDFLANGNAALGLCNIVEQGGGKVRGIGIVIEKSFMDGATKIRNAGYRLESLVQVKSLAGGKIEFL